MLGSPPPGFRLARRLSGRDWSFSTHRSLVLLLTFVAYAAYHASRKPTSIVKSVLDPSGAERDPGGGWPPFVGPDGTARLGEIDVAFLACYSIGMYAAGHLGDRLDLRIFLTVGMVGSGIFVVLFGMGFFWGVHSFVFYLAMQMLAGFFQATGWPSVVAVVGNWCGERRRGLIMGVWNAHTSIGNISGSLIAAGVLQFGWGWSFILPGVLIAAAGILVFSCLAAYPEDMGFDSPNRGAGEQRQDEESRVPRPPLLDEDGRKMHKGDAVGIHKALLIPGVIPFALCLFFAKLVAYTFLYWLPFYLTETAIGGQYISVKAAGNLSTLFDVGGIFGGIMAGFLSDKLNARATIAASFMYLAIPSLFAFYYLGPASHYANIILMMISGLFVNGPYALITTAVSADLGTHSSLRGNSRALATVTAIIDGTGSAGAALGPLLTGYLSRIGWFWVFTMLMVGAFIAGALLFPLVKSEIKQIVQRRRHSSVICTSQQAEEGSVATPFLTEKATNVQ